MFLFMAFKCHNLWTKCWRMSLSLISKLMEREGTFQRGGKIFGEISGHWFSLDLSLDISIEEKGCIENKVIKKKTNGMAWEVEENHKYNALWHHFPVEKIGKSGKIIQ